MKLIHSDQHRVYLQVRNDSIDLLHTAAARCYHMAVALYTLRTHSTGHLAQAAESQSVLMVSHHTMSALNEKNIDALLTAQDVVEKILDKYEEEESG